MERPKEFEDVFRGADLTKDEIRTLTWITGWERRTVENLKSVIQKVKETAISTLQAENENLRDELERMKEIMRYNGIMVIPSKYPGGRSEWNIPKPHGQKED